MAWSIFLEVTGEENRMENKFYFLEVVITWMAMRIAGTSVYKNFADNLGLEGREQVMDFGCGLGTVAKYTAALIPDGNLVCVDISEKRLATCRKTVKKYVNVECLAADPDALQFQDETFDVIYCHFVLHEVNESELTETLERMFRWLRVHGKLIYREPVTDSVRMRHLDAVLQDIGFVRESARIIDIPLMGTTMEAKYEKRRKREDA